MKTSCREKRLAYDKSVVGKHSVEGMSAEEKRKSFKVPLLLLLDSRISRFSLHDKNTF